MDEKLLMHILSQMGYERIKQIIWLAEKGLREFDPTDKDVEDIVLNLYADMFETD